MSRVALAVLAAAALVGCDSAIDHPTSDARFVGAWEAVSVEETTVVSRTDQRGRGYDLPGRGAIEVTGAIEARYRYIRRLDEESDQGAAADLRRGHLSLFGDRASTLVRTDADGRTDTFDLSGLAFSLDEDAGTITVPEQTFSFYLGEVTVGGSLTLQGFDVPAGVPTALPVKLGREIAFDLTLAADGTFTRAYPWRALRVEGTWTSRGDAVTLEAAGAEPSTFTLVDGALVQPGPTTQPESLEQAAGQRGLQPGSLTSATTTHSTRLTRVD